MLDDHEEENDLCTCIQYWGVEKRNDFQIGISTVFRKRSLQLLQKHLFDGIEWKKVKEAGAIGCLKRLLSGIVGVCSYLVVIMYYQTSSR